MAGSRVANSVRNVFAAWGGQAVSVIASFVVRAVFVSVLAQEYVGLESLFSSVLTILCLADLGVGSAITFALYEPLANDDVPTLKSIMRVFKRAYIVIGCAIIGIGAILAPNISVLLGADAPEIPLLEVYFFCFVLNTGISYFFSYKGALITADQKAYIVFLITYSFQILMSLAQIAVLLLTHNYLLFLVCMISSTLLQNIVIALQADKRYSFLKEKDVEPLDKAISRGIIKNVTGLIMHRVAGICSAPVSNLIITGFLSLTVTSLYGNYLLVTNALTRIVDRAFDSLIASVGNLSAEADEDRQYEVFQTVFFINAFVYTAITGGLLCAINPFICFWVGPDWQFGRGVVIAIALMFFVKGMRSAGMTFTSAYGLYWFTKWKAVLEAVFLPLFALLLVKPFGMIGVLAASVIVSVFIAMPYEAWAVYRKGFHKPLHYFFLAYIKYVLVGLPAIAAAYAICLFLPIGNYVLAFFIDGAIGVAVPVAVFLACFGRLRESREFFSIAKRLMGSVSRKLLHR